MNLEAAKKAQIELCETSKKMYHSGLVAGTWGNLSVRIDEDYCVVTPSGMSYETLCPEDMVIMNIHDNSTNSHRKPSIEYAMHTGLLLAHPELNAVVHTHSTYALTIATAGIELPPVCDDQVQILGGSVPITPPVVPGSIEMANAVIAAMETKMGCFIPNHGAVTLGATLEKALVAANVLEKSCQVFLMSQLIGGPVLLKQKEIDDMRDFFLHRYGQGK